AAQRFAWCSVCRRSSDSSWRRHAFARGHQQRALAFLATRAQELAALAATRGPQTRWRCSFCEIRDAAGWPEAVEHFASSAHRAALDAFCVHHRCDVSRELRAQLALTSERRRQLLAELQQREAEEEKRAAGDADAEDEDAKAAATAAAFLTVAATRLQQVQTATAATTAEPREAVGAAAPPPPTRPPLPLMAPTQNGARVKTVASSAGVQQNPLGRTPDGLRVWGGGIVKLRKHEWIPWPIDLLVKHENDQNSGAANAFSQPHVAGTSAADTAAGESTAAFTHRVTEMAFSAGLGRVARVSWGDSVANVHTAAVPPWMVQSEDEYKRCNERQVGAERRKPLPPRHQPTATAVAPAARRTPPTATTAAAAGAATWLPNFGGVWQEGSRAQTKHEFKRSLPATGAVSSSSSSSSALQFRPASVYQRRRQCNAEPPVPTPTPTPTPTPLDAKKQLLLAQKERLRAKLAAKRAPTR
ncbi:hypothetical protein PybrP1_007457, partial [[Pythium] brassicae (nom. inval.)]